MRYRADGNSAEWHPTANCKNESIEQWEHQYPVRFEEFSLIRDSGAADFTFSYPDYEAYRDSVHSFSGLIAFAPEHLRLSNAGGIITQRASAAGSVVSAFSVAMSPSSPSRLAAMRTLRTNGEAGE